MKWRMGVSLVWRGGVSLLWYQGVNLTGFSSLADEKVIILFIVKTCDKKYLVHRKTKEFTYEGYDLSKISRIIYYRCDANKEFLHKKKRTLKASNSI